jgi:2-haloacid dehalogenase
MDLRTLWTGVSSRLFERGETTSEELRLKRFRLLFEEIHITLEPGAFSLSYLKYLARCSDLFPGAAEVLESLSGRYHIAIVTNGMSTVNRPRLEQSSDHLSRKSSFRKKSAL